MGFGEDPFGVPAFALGIPTAGARRPVKPVLAYVYDATRRRWTVEADGRYASGHPVDQFVRMTVAWAVDAAASNIDQGNPSQRERSIGADHQERVRNNILSRLQPRVTAGELSIGVLRIDIIESGGTATYIEYRNRVTGRNQARRFA